MSDQPSSLPQSPDDPSPAQPQPAKRSYRWLIIGLTGLLGLTCVCVAVVAVLVIRSMASMPEDMRAVEGQINQFMQDGMKQDAAAAYALFSARGQQNKSLADIQKLFGKSSSPLFSGYKGLQATSYRFHSGPDGDKDLDERLPAGNFAVLVGVLNYDGGVTGTFDAILEQVGTAWKLYDIQIGVPPNKYRNNRSG